MLPTRTPTYSTTLHRLLAVTAVAILGVLVVSTHQASAQPAPTGNQAAQPSVVQATGTAVRTALRPNQTPVATTEFLQYAKQPLVNYPYYQFHPLSKTISNLVYAVVIALLILGLALIIAGSNVGPALVPILKKYIPGKQ